MFISVYSETNVSLVNYYINTNKNFLEYSTSGISYTSCQATKFFKFTSTPKQLIKNQQEATILGEAVNIRPKSHTLCRRLKQILTHFLSCTFTSVFQSHLMHSFIHPLSSFAFTLTSNHIMPGQGDPTECPISKTDRFSWPDYLPHAHYS